jgi:hypothetical protein
MTKQLSDQRPPVKQAQQRQEQREGTRRQSMAQLAAKRKRNFIIGTITCIVIIGVLIGITTAVSAFSSSNNTATSDVNQLAPPVDNIQCDAAEQLAFHIHAHLSIYIDGKAVPLPAQVGITNTCFYWLHTHDTSGVIHMEAPQVVTLRLGTFLKMWRDQFPQLQYPTQLSSTTGWKIYIDGEPYNGNFNTIQLKSHELITLAYNTPNVVPDTVFNWNGL